MTHGLKVTLALTALCGAIALGSCRTATPGEGVALARLSPVSEAAARTDVVPALSLAASGATSGARVDTYERAVAKASLTYEFEKQSCDALPHGSRTTCLATAFDHFADLRARAHAARMAALAGG